MRRTRFMSGLFLVLSAAFFFVPAFRQAFTMPISLVAFEGNRAPQWVRFGSSDLREWAATAENERDAKTLAFAGLHISDNAEAERLIDKAVAIDPKLGWAYFSLISKVGQRGSPKMLVWAQKLEQFEPNNALGYLQEGEYYRENDAKLNKLTGVVGKDAFETLAANTQWRSAMQKAFAAEKYDSHVVDRFALERDVAQRHHAATPARMLFSVSSYPIANLLNIRQYAVFEVNYLGKNAEDAGKPLDALPHYWSVFNFGQKMDLGSAFLIEQLIGNADVQIAAAPLAAALRKVGQDGAAVAVDTISARLIARARYYRGDDVLSRSTNYLWSALLVVMFEILVAVFGILTGLSVLYVNAKRFVRKDVKGRLYAAFTTAENYLPVVLFILCIGLYISYYPYARNFQQYMTASGNMHDLESVFMHTIAVPYLAPSVYELPVGNPFLPYAWYALAGMVLLAIVEALTRTKQPQPQRAKAAAAK